MTRIVIAIMSAAAAAVSVLTSVVAVADSPVGDAAHALAQRFIDGPANETGSRETRAAIEPNLRAQQSGAAQELLEAERRIELQELTDKLRSSRAALSRRRLDFTNNSPGNGQRVSSSLASRVKPRRNLGVKFGSGALTVTRGPLADGPSSRVAVLLFLRPSQRSSPRFAQTADPILCMGKNCYVSNGPVAPARRLRRSRALGPFNSIGQRAGACRNQTRCVFRRVALYDHTAAVQPIDLGWIRHDRRRALRGQADTSCAIKGRSLTCQNPVETSNYRLWLVPEATARRAGSRMLLSALAGGLNPNPVHAGITPTLRTTTLDR
ncbi:MAG: hypothetical protein ACR2PG_10730 [Hyphomicrobiaceae bacterium]